MGAYFGYALWVWGDRVLAGAPEAGGDVGLAYLVHG